MEKMIFSQDELINLSFGLTVEGTTSVPQEVSAILICTSKKYGVIANKENDLYHATFDLQNAGVDLSNLQLAIEVLINGRIYRPFKKEIAITIEEPIQTIEFDQIPVVVQPAIEQQPEVVQQAKEPGIPQKILTNIFSEIFTTEEKEPKKITIKFDKKKSVETNKIAPLEETLPSIANENIFTSKISKKQISKHVVKKSIQITEGKIVYL